MGMFNKILSAIRVNDEFDEEDDDFLEDEELDEDDLDDEEEEDDDEEEEEKPRRRFFRKMKDDFDDEDDDEEEEDDDEDDEEEESRSSRSPFRFGSKAKEPAPEPVKEKEQPFTITRTKPSSSNNKFTAQSSKVTPMRKKGSSLNNMEVVVIKPASMEDTREIADSLGADHTVILNLEGVDVDVAQRIIDFCCGSTYMIQGSLQKVSSYIFILTPNGVEISGDYQDILSSAFDLPSMRMDY